MSTSIASRVRIAFFLIGLVLTAGVLAFGPVANSQTVQPAADPAPDFGRLLVSPPNLTFALLNYDLKKGRPASESRIFTVENTGRGTNTLMVTVGPITGTGASSFSISLPAGTYNLLPGKAAAQSFMVTFTPLNDGRVTAQIMISSSDTSGQRGVTGRVVNLIGNARGPIPTASSTPTPFETATPTPTPAVTETPTPTPFITGTPTPTPGATETPSPTPTTLATGTPTATPTATTSPTATSTPTASPTPTAIANSGADRNSANAPGIQVSGTTVVVTVPQGSDDNGTQTAYQVEVEGASPLPSPTLVTTDRVNSCAPTASGQVVCSGQGGTVDLIPAGAATSPTILHISSSTIPTLEYAIGDCQGCGAMVDDALGTAIISSGLGYDLLNLSDNTFASPIALATTNNGKEAPGVDFGYDKVNHLILSANYQVTNLMSFMQSNPDFQVINISNPATPLLYSFAQAQPTGQFFNHNGRVCGASPESETPSDSLPETTAIDTSTNIAYVTFHTKAACFNDPPDDIAMFDMSKATFNSITHTWNTPNTLIQSITGTGLNGIDPIAVDSHTHLALVSAGDNNFGVLVLPTSTASLTITDWVNALMPNDPSNVAWSGWHSPGGLATYVSPTTGKVIGVLMNNPSSSGGYTGSTYLALVDMQGLLNATRDPTSAHKVDGSVNLTSSGLVTFIQVK